MEFLAASVCQRTNWDRLRKHLLTAAADPISFTAIRLANLTADEFSREFSTAFNSVTDLADRHVSFVAVAAAFAAGGELFNEKRLYAEPQRLGGPDGLYATIDRLSVFRADPQRKKSRVLVQQLIRTDLLTIIDPDQMRPAIEYHLMRLYLRTGRVVHADAYEFRDKGDRATDVRSVTALRAAVEQAMHYSAAGADLTIAEINDLEWQIARSFCERVGPRCDGPPSADKPVVASIAAARGGACPFSSTCDAPRHPAIAALTEPRLADHHPYY